ncbi:retrovirus-related pol polyprotein from transposon TNT 1-94 [Tanacetum coccineum]
MAGLLFNKFKRDRVRVLLVQEMLQALREIMLQAKQGLLSVIIVRAHEYGHVLDDEQLAFLSDPGVTNVQVTQTTTPLNVTFQIDDLDASSSDCDDISLAKTVFMANLSSYGSDILSKATQHDTYQNDDMLNQSVQETQYFEQSLIDYVPDNEITSDSNIISYEQYLQETQNAIVQDTNSSTQQDSMIISMFEHMSEQMSSHVTNWDKFSNPIFEQPVVQTTPVRIEPPRELPKVSMVKTSFQKLKNHLASFDKVVKVRTTPDAITEGSRGFEHTKAVFKQEVIPFIKTLWDLFKDFNNSLHSELNEVKTIFNQREAAVEQYVMNVMMHADFVPVNVLPAKHKCLVNDNLESERLIQENDHLFELLLSQDIVHICVNSLVTLTNYDKMEQDYINKYSENLVLKAKLAKKEQMNNISLNNQNAPELLEFFKINEWQAKLDAKDVSIANLKKHIESLNGKNVIENVAPTNKAKVIAPEMFKLDLEPLSPKVLKNRDAHIDYIKHTQENIDILRELVEHARVLKPLDNDLDSSCKKFRFVEPATSSSNTQKQVDSHKTQDSNKPVLPSTGMKSSTSASRSQPSSNTKNNRISQTTSSNMKNKVENHSRSVKSNSNKVNRVSEPVCNANVKHTMLNANLKLICVKCNQCMFDANHDLCFLEFINDVNVRSKSKSAKSSKRKKTWKPTGKVAFRKYACCIRDLDGVDLLKGSRGSNLYTFSLEDMMLSSPIISCLKHQRPSLGYGIGEAVATACYTQNRSLIPKRHNKTSYELLHNKKPDLSYLHVFGALCYPTNDSEDLGKLKPKSDIRIFLGYAPEKKAYRIYSKRIRLVSNLPSPTPYVPPTKNVWDTLFQPMFDEYFNPPPSVASLVPTVDAPEPADSTSTPSSTTIDQDAPSPSTSQTSQETQSLVIPFGIEEHFHDIDVAHLDNDPFFGVSIPELNFEESSSRDVIPTNVHSVNQPPKHLTLFCYFDAFLSSVEPKNYKEALKEAYWIKSMKKELNEFQRLKVWELVPRPDRVMIITLKWIFNVKLDELGGILKNKARFVARGYYQEEGINFKESFAPVA